MVFYYTIYQALKLQYRPALLLGMPRQIFEGDHLDME